jgi:dihydrofolate synthase / folylpolyglutamate synthase
MPVNHSIQEMLSQFGREKRAHYSLENLQRALAAAGNPEKSVYSLIIGGTNGKGSCSLLISAALLEAGYRVETYLSPHLCSPTERFLENGVPIAEATLAEWMRSTLETAHQYSLSYFEFLTYIAFLKAKANKVDFLVLEVGLGGRLDATNLCDPLASVIASIGLDHQELLGTTESAILKEKLAIVRSEGLLFTGVSDATLVAQIEQHCLDIDAIPYYSRELQAQTLRKGFWGQTAEINGYPFELSCPSPTALENAKTSLLLLRILFPKLHLEIFRRGFRKVLLPARFETLCESPRVLFSGDHNVAAVESLLATWRTLQAHPRGKLFTYAAFSPDKDFEKMIPMLRQVSHQLTVGMVPGFESLMPASYAAYQPDLRDPNVVIEALLGELTTDDTLLITGSLYLASTVRPRWWKRVRFLATEAEVQQRFGLAAGVSNPATAAVMAREQKLGPAFSDGARVRPPIGKSPHHTPVNPSL